MRSVKLILLILCLSLQMLASANEVITYNSDYYHKHSVDNLFVDDNDFDLLIIGDWGRNGHYSQKSVAKWMDITSHLLDAEMIVTTGDNFYDNGIASVDDPLWISAFESIYHGPNLFVNWHPVLGNHDYRGNWQAQIDYSQRSRRWQMPAQYYDKVINLEDGTTAHLLFLDTNALNPDYANVPKYAETQKQDVQAQLSWIEDKLKKSTATWRIVFGHHPLYSSGKRNGNTSAIRNVLEPIFEKYSVQAYFAGHEHDLQHNQPEGTTVEHFISGAGSKLRPTGQVKFTRFAKSKGGFAALSIGTKKLVVQFIDDTGILLYKHDIVLELQ